MKKEDAQFLETLPTPDIVDAWVLDELARNAGPAFVTSIARRSDRVKWRISQGLLRAYDQGLVVYLNRDGWYLRPT